MSEAAGVVQAVSSKKLDSGTYYSFCIDDIWYRTGRDPIPFEKGYTVKFIFDENKYGKQVDLTTLKTKEGEALAQSTAGGALLTHRGNKSEYQQKEQYWKGKDLRDIDTQKQIRMAGALNTAINMVNGAIAVDCIAVPKGKNLGARFDAYTAMVQEEANRLYSVIAHAPDDHNNLMEQFDGEEDVETELEIELEKESEEEWS